MKQRVRKLLPLLLALVLVLGVMAQAVYALPPLQPVTPLLPLQPVTPLLPELKMDITAKFEDAKFLAEVRKILGKQSADPIYNTDVADITSLKVTSKSISSLAGIEYFTGLKELNCYSNKLTTLDVSRSTELEYFDCRKNKLTALDVSKNTALKTLKCDDNELTALDVSRNTVLEYFDCHKNKLTALDVSKNTALQKLACSNNQLTALDVSKNTALKMLKCHSNKLTALDVSRNTVLEIFACAGNPLTTLDVSKNTALQKLLCSDNQLTALDVSKNIKLEDFFCESNKLTALDVSKNTKLDWLVCYDNQLTALDVSKNTELRILYIENNFLVSKASIKGLNEAQIVYFSFEPQRKRSDLPMLPNLPGLKTIDIPDRWLIDISDFLKNDLENILPAPRNLTATPGDGQITLSWTAPALRTADSSIVGYEVSLDDGMTWTTTQKVYDQRFINLTLLPTSHTFAGLTNGRTYVLMVRAFNMDGSGEAAAITAVPAATAEQPEPAETGQPFYENASSWAIPELDQAAGHGLIPDILKGVDMTKSITREEFAELAVMLYEKSAGTIAPAASPSPFTDTANPQILKAYQIGITAGTSATAFSPQVLISREQCATMLYRAIKAIAPNADYSLTGIPDFPDQTNIAFWAVEGTKYMSKLGIIKGDTGGNFMPKPVAPAHEASGYGMAAREAAVLMTVRTFEEIN